MAKYILKRKVFADDDQQKKSGLGKKLMIGLGTVGTVAGSFALAKSGRLGAGLQRSSNTLWGNTGAKLSNWGMTNWGNSMMKSGAAGVGKAAERTAAGKVKLHNKLVETAQKEGKTLTQGTKGYNFNQGMNQFTEQQAKQRIQTAGQRAESQALGKFQAKANPQPKPKPVANNPQPKPKPSANNQPTQSVMTPSTPTTTARPNGRAKDVLNTTLGE